MTMVKTRTTTLHLVPSQFTERIKARDVRTEWAEPRRSIVDRASTYWATHQWPIWVGIVLVIAAISWGIVRYA